jgi:hypothetical protein
MFTFVTKTIAGYGAQIGDHYGPIAAYGMYYPTPENAENDAIDWGVAENCRYEEFNLEKYWKEFE